MRPARALVAMLLLAAGLGAAEVQADDELAEIRERFEARYRELFELKLEGKIGEAYTGYIQFVAEVYRDGPISKLVNEENTDRKLFYYLLANELREKASGDEKKKISSEVVARRNAVRNFESAKPDEFLKMPDGVWIRKRDETAYKKILALKEDGEIGETTTGLLAVRTESPEAQAAVERENERRRVFYQHIADIAEEPVGSIAARYAREHFREASSSAWLYQVNRDRWVQARNLR